MQHKKFKVTLMAEGPVHIGNGESYSQKEYVYEDESYYFPNMTKLYQKLLASPTKLQKFETFLKKDPKKNQKATRLVNLLREIKFTDRDLGGYKIKATGFEGKNPGKISEIHQFVKDAYGNPYIPGSSLKGALRTILVNEHFGTDQIPWGEKDDIFNEIHVSDSQPLASKNLVLVAKYDYNPKKHVAKSLPIVRESLAPLTRASFTITTTSQRAQSLVEDLPTLAEAFYERYFQKHLQYLPDKYQQKSVYSPLYLGGGSGLWTKGDYHHMDIEDIRRRTPKKTKMKGNGVFKLTKAPNREFKYKKKDGKIQVRTLIENEEKMFQMGKCSFKIQEVD